MALTFFESAIESLDQTLGRREGSFLGAPIVGAALAAVPFTPVVTTVVLSGRTTGSTSCTVLLPICECVLKSSS